MTETRNDTVSVVDRTRAVAAGGAIIGSHFLGRTAVFVLAEEALVFAEPDGEMRRMDVHGGAILASASDGARIVSGGDDGKVVMTDAGSTRVLAIDAKHRWVDHVAFGPDGAVAWSAGKTAFVQGKELREFEAPSTVGGLAFLPKGFRLAVAHYNGASLWFPNAAGAVPEKLEWKGSHLGVTVSPDGRFVVTTMQEPMLHGWRIVDRQHMRMSGYSARVTSFGWTTGGRWLATSGSNQVILWPFHTKDGPMGKQPRLVGADRAKGRGRRVPSAAGHHRRRLRRRHGADRAHRRRRRDPGQETRRCAGHGAGLERGRHAARVRYRERRGRRD